MPEGPNHIRNKIVREKEYAKRKATDKLEKREAKKKKKRQEQLLVEAGEAVPEKEVPRTLDNTREFDETMVEQDEEGITLRRRMYVRACMPDAMCACMHARCNVCVYACQMQCMCVYACQMQCVCVCMPDAMCVCMHARCNVCMHCCHSSM
jgi:hypothetical protein